MSKRDGAVAILVAFSIGVLVVMVGMATDAARGYLIKARLAQALDAAALAGGRNFFHPDRDDDIRMYFAANLPPGYLGASINGPTITEDIAAGTVTLSANATLPTTFMKMVGKDNMDVVGSTEVTRLTRSLDLVVAIDMSGSMGKDMAGNTPGSSTDTRIHAARVAALELVDKLWGSNTDPTHNLLKIGVVPWNGQVNVSIDGSTYDPDQTTAVAAPVVPGYDHPITGDPVTLHHYVSNSPVPLLRLPPGRTAIKDWDLKIDKQGGNKAVITILSTDNSIRWDSAGFSVGGTLSLTNAENTDNEGDFTIVKINSTHSDPAIAGKELTVYPASGMIDNFNDTAVDSQGTYIWDGCVYARYIPQGNWPNADSGVDFTNASDSAFDDDADTVLYGKGFGSRRWEAWEPITGETHFTTTSSFKCTQSMDATDCGSICLSHGITAMTNVRADIESAINDLQVPEGSTNIPQGLAWAFRALMPGTPFDQATQTGNLTTKRQQAIILLTDGQNQNWWGNSYKGAWGSSSTTNTTAGRLNMDERLLDLAQEIKDYNANQSNGEDAIQIYTIMFLAPPSVTGMSQQQFDDLETLMKDVATRSTVPYYHNAPSQAELAKVFKEIANHLSLLRISK